MRIKKFVLLALPLLLALGVILTAGCAAGQTKTLPSVIKDVTAREAFTLTQENSNNRDFVILDVRTPQEFAAGHIAKAINIDFYSPAFGDKIDSLDRNKTYLLHCRSGTRSQVTFDMMKKLNFLRIYHMTGGILEWEADGLPTVKESSSNGGLTPTVIARSPSVSGA